MRVAGDKRGRAMMALGLDSPANDEVVRQIAAVPDIFSARQAKL